ncbi:MAG: hypothetical protein ACFB21_02110 [Opitutales bacterium]
MGDPGCNPGAGFVPTPAIDRLAASGVRFFVSWPAQLPRGTDNEAPVITLDLYPTFCADARAKLPEATTLDGRSLLDLIPGWSDPSAQRGPLFWSRGPEGAMRHGEWKIVVDDNETELYHLRTDRGETADLA